jgi:hypothetical protein
MLAIYNSGIHTKIFRGGEGIVKTKESYSKIVPACFLFSHKTGPISPNLRRFEKL